MNERIQELAEQANLRKWSETPAMHFVKEQFDGDLEKFAELIVMECAEVYRSKVRSDRIMYPTEFSAALINHFGIKE